MGNKQEELRKQEGYVDFSNSIIFNTKAENLKDEYKKIRFLNDGSYGKVYLIKHKKTELLYVLKRIKITEENRLTGDEIKNGINILKGIEHPNIIKIHGLYITEKKYYLILEYCQGGNLFEFRRDNKLSEEQITYIMYQILLAVNYCHKNKIIHRDLKPDNILIKSYINNICEIKLCDFGTAKILKKNQKLKEPSGTVYYRAPEVIEGRYDEKCDLWSCGVIMYYLLTEFTLFASSRSSSDIKNALKELPYIINKLHISANTKDLLMKLLVYEPEKRINAEDALNHNLFKNVKELFKINDEAKIKKYIKNLSNYKCNSPIQKLALGYLIHNFDYFDEIRDLTKFFKSFDVQKKGKINKNELSNGLNSWCEVLKISKFENKDIDKIFTNIDTDNNKIISYGEFVRAAIDKKIFMKKEILQLAYRYFDRENKGVIYIKDLKEFFQKHLKNNEDIKNLEITIQALDENKNQIFEYNEFFNVMVNILQ